MILYLRFKFYYNAFELNKRIILLNNIYEFQQLVNVYI